MHIMRNRNMHLEIWKLVALLAVPALASCATLSPTGLIAASRLDPLNTPPDQIAVAVGVPESIRLQSGDAKLRIAFASGATSSSVVVDEQLPLQMHLGGSAAPQGRAGETVYLAHLKPDDAARFAAAQAKIRDLRARGTVGSGRLNVEVTSGCFVGLLPDRLPVSSWLRTDPGDGFVQLTDATDVYAALGAQAAAVLRGRLQPC